MAPGNCTRVTGFIFWGITDSPKLQNILFVFFFAISFCTLVGNVWMIVLISVDSQHHSSMYFFLSNLSLFDVVSSPVIAPKVMLSSLVKSKDISFPGCVVQFFLFSFCGNNELCLLAVTAYDRFVAIYNPLLYNVIMSKRVCFQLVVGSSLCACVNATVHTCTEFNLSFGHSNVLNHFFCPCQEISCSDFRINKRVHFIFAAIETIGTILTILISYIYIIFAILRICSTAGRHKAFPTCASHPTVISILYGTLIFTYLRPSSGSSVDWEKMVAVFYTLVIPLLNPLIYSLRNKEVKGALRTTVYQKLVPQCM
ncbi:olfactory receptor 1009-like [Terrapene carolina triunguis]|uniref:olfactory receptor 1009-like n=1 Tax=Terrapene triunguis TaxID=2587831 RepID=UPI000E77387A|nr:olfactory receptor 1009-like [Terrapene carolina triunguis]